MARKEKNMPKKAAAKKRPSMRAAKDPGPKQVEGAMRTMAGSMGAYKGPKPRAYTSLSKGDKAKEDAQNTRDMAAKMNAKKKGTKKKA